MTSEVRPPIDAELEETAWPALVEAGLTVPLTPARIAEMRELSDAFLATDEVLTRGGAVGVEERTIPGPAGLPDLPVLVMRPAGRSGPLPCVYYTANGGKITQSTRIVIGDLEASWVDDMGLVVVSISPPVGPEHPHPALIDGAYTGLVWLADHADELGVDPERIIIYGKSGGGGLAAATALMARDRGGPALSHQILIYPMLDDREITVSSKFEGIPWDRTSNRTGWTAMLGDAAGGADVSPYAAPARAADLTGLPPTYLETGSSEVFRDEILEYAARLAHAGVPMELHCWAGGYHGFELTGPEAEISRACVSARTSFLRRALRPQPSRPVP